MRMTFENGMYVGMTRSGRRYVGLTAEEAERKYLLALLHCYKRQLGGRQFEEICAAQFQGICSLGDLSILQLREFKGLVDDANRFQRAVTDRNKLEPRLTERQRKRIVRLGRYVLGERYGKDWFWKKLPEWTKKTRLDDLTHAEAHYVIQRLEKIEAALSRTRAA